jgi:hypothetical protein
VNVLFHCSGQCDDNCGLLTNYIYSVKFKVLILKHETSIIRTLNILGVEEIFFTFFKVLVVGSTSAIAYERMVHTIHNIK